VNEELSKEVGAFIIAEQALIMDLFFESWWF
jgi:hypothetical protein